MINRLSLSQLFWSPTASSPFNKLRATVTVVFATILATSFATTTELVASPQDEQEMIENIGPSTEYFNAEAIRVAVYGWKWKSELSSKQQKLILESTQEWKNRFARAQDQLNALRSRLAKGEISFPIDPRAVQAIEQNIADTKSQIAGMSAELELFVSNSKLMRRELELKLDARKGQMELLKNDLELAIQKLDTASRMAKKGAIAKSELRETEHTVRRLELDLVMTQKELKNLASQLDNKSGPVAATTRKMKDSEERLLLLRERKELIVASDAILESRKLESEMAFAEKMIEIARTRQFELALDNTRYEALIQLAAERMESEGSAADPREEDSPSRREDIDDNHQAR